MSFAKVLSVLAIALAVASLVTASLVMVFKYRHRHEPLVYGVSFSKDYSQSLGLDWQANYQAIFSELGFKKVRLMSYWDDHEPTPGHYDFADLDKQFETAERAGAKVSLSIGLRQPRWPECHQPEWAKQLDQDKWQQRLYSYISQVVERYRDHAALESYQLENEYYNRDFGTYCSPPQAQRLKEEFDLVKNLDGNTPIIMNQSNQFGLAVRAPHPDIYGFSVYRRVFDARVLKRYITHPLPAWFHSLRAQVIEMFSGKPVMIHELQAEPWAPKPLTQISGEEQSQTLSTLQLRRNLAFAKATGIREQYLWGAEYWYWRKTGGDASYWQIIQQAVRTTHQ